MHEPAHAPLVQLDLSRDLFRRAREASEHARSCGALGPIETVAHDVTDGEARFVVRVVSSLAEKERAARERPSGADPFLPYDPKLFVADVGDAHVLLLNKFPVVADHLLLVTRAFEPQDEPFTLADLEALDAVSRGQRALAFYNAGRIAGASQAHRHLQLVPEEVPLEPQIRAGTLPFPHAFDARPDAPREAHALYLAMLEELGCDGPHDVLMTSSWMLVVPRSRERFESISVNALGFAGSLLVKDQRELDRVREVGPIAVLRHVAGV